MSFHKTRYAFFCFLAVALTGCGSPAEREAHYIKRGNDLFNTGDYDKARIEYKNAAKIKPNDPEVSYRMGLLEEADGNIGAAFRDFLYSQGQNQHYAPALLKLAEYYLASEQYEKADESLGTILTDTPEDQEGHALHAALLLHEKDFLNAEKEARAVLSHSSNVTAYSVLAGLYAAQGDMSKADTTLQEAISKNPTDLSLLLLRAKLNRDTHNLDKVAEAYKAIFKLKPKESRYRSDLALIYIQANQFDNAESIFRTAIIDIPDNWDLKHQFVEFLAQYRNPEAAETEVKTYITANPDRDDLYKWLVDLYLSKNQIDKATALLDQIIAKNGSNKLGLNAEATLSHIDYLKNDKAQAAQLADKVLTKDPRNAEALFVRATLSYNQGLYQNAETDLRTIIQEQPNSKEALRLLSETLLQRNHKDLAIDILNQILDKNPTDIQTHVRLAEMYNLNGDSKRAMDILFLLTKQNPKDASVWIATAGIAIDGKDWSTADLAIKSLSSIDGQHQAALFFKAQMLLRQGMMSDAVKYYTDTINADPASPIAEQAVRGLVAADQASNHIEDAVQYIQSLKSDNPVFNTVLGECYLQLGKTDLAAAAFDAAIAKAPAQQEAYLQRAKIFFNQHQTDASLEILKKAEATSPDDIRATLMEAEILSGDGQYKQAMAIYDDLLGKNPDLDEVANNYAELAADYDFNDPATLEKARQMAERFIGSPNPLLLDTLAWVYYRQDNIQQALAIMDRIVAMHANLPEQAHYHCGAILLKAGKLPEAKQELELATKTPANYPGYDNALKLLTRF